MALGLGLTSGARAIIQLSGARCSVTLLIERAGRANR